MRYVHYFEGELRYRMPTNSMNYITLAKSKFGASIDHDKSAIILNAAAVFTVICRPLMRRLLERNAVDAAEKLEARALRKNETPSQHQEKVEKERRGAERARDFKLGETTAPFTKDRECFRCGDGRYLRLFRFVGERCLGLSNWGANINRTIQVTLILEDAAAKGMGSDNLEVRAATGKGRHGHSSVDRNYNLASTVHSE